MNRVPSASRGVGAPSGSSPGPAAGVQQDPDHRLRFVKRSNEWAERDFLKLDQEHERGFLQSLVSESKASS